MVGWRCGRKSAKVWQKMECANLYFVAEDMAWAVYAAWSRECQAAGWLHEGQSLSRAERQTLFLRGRHRGLAEIPAGEGNLPGCRECNHENGRRKTR